MSCRHTGAEPTRYIIIVKPIPPIKDRYLNDRDGLRLKITGIRRNSELSTNPQIKSGNYLNNVLCLVHETKIHYEFLENKNQS